MALVLKDRVKETTTTTGTGSFSLAGAVTGYDSFGQIGSGNTTYYAVYLDGGSEWEVGIGTYTSPSTLSRDTILASSASGAKVTFSAGQKTIWCDYPAGTSVYVSNNGSQTSGQVLKSNGVGTPPTWQTTTNGDVVGPASATDNAVARFDTTTGKLLQNSVVTVGDTGAVSGVTTLSASTSVTTPIVQATNSAGLALRNSAGTTQISMGGGGGDNVTIAVATNINGANAQIDISPTGTGHVHIKPTGTGSLEIAPTNAGTMNNMVIGGVTPLAITGTTITATSFVGSGASLTNVVNSLTASTGISVSGSTGSVTVTNTAPDQTVSLTAGTGISTSGTYPSFTITNTAPDQTVAIASGTGISVTGTYPSFTVTNTAPAVNFTYTTNYIPFGQGTTTPNQSANLTYTTGTGALRAPELEASNGLVVNNLTIATSYSIPSGYGASSVGPVTVNSGVTVTVPSGSRWVVL
jgi:hypothetical protein